MPWRICIDVTAETRQRAEARARGLFAKAVCASADGEVYAWPNEDARLECGDPGLAHRPQDADLSIAGEGDTAGAALSAALGETL